MNMSDEQQAPWIPLPNGCRLYWEDNTAGGRTYYSDEIGGDVTVWDTCLVSESTLLASLVQEHKLRWEEDIEQARLGLRK